MSEDYPSTPAYQFDERPLAQLILLAREINQTRGRLTLYIFAGLLIAVIVATAFMQVELNGWNQPFYDAIARRDFGEFVRQLFVFFGLVAVLTVLNVGQTGCNQFIRTKLRQLATRDLIDNWMAERRAARISRAGQIGVNPDQRIHQDAHHLTDLSTDLGVGLVQSFILLVSFIGVLWVLSSGIVINIEGHILSIPGYMVWAALAYALSGSVLSWFVARPLVRLNTNLYAREADLRVALVRAAGQADSIAINGAEPTVREGLHQSLSVVIGISIRIVLATVRLTGVTASYGWVAIVFPIIVAAPGYFSGKLSFGALMMVVGAFNQVQQALRWFVDNTGVIADWRATLLRVMEFRQALIDLDRFEAGVAHIERDKTADGHLVLDNLVIASFRGRAELGDRHVDIAPGGRVLVTGKPGTGKSSLFLALAGLWNWGSGHIGLPADGDVMFLSQTPYLPDGTLRSALTYGIDKPPADSVLTAALKRVGLPQLASSLDRTESWQRDLGFTEQMRLSLARVLLLKPKWVVADDAINLADDAERQVVESIFTEELSGTGVLSISASPARNGFYGRVIPLVAHPVKARGQADAAPGEAVAQAAT